MQVKVVAGVVAAEVVVVEKLHRRIKGVEVVVYERCDTCVDTPVNRDLRRNDRGGMRRQNRSRHNPFLCEKKNVV